MNRLFFYLFFFWSRNKEYKEFSGLIALVTLLFLSVLNILSVIGMSTFFSKDGLVVFPEHLNSKPKILILVILWGVFLGFMSLKRGDLKYYRERIKKLNEDQALKAKNYALMYIVGSLLFFFLMAVIIVQRIPN